MPLRRRGKVGNQWVKDRADWVKAHLPNHEGYYVCAICGRWVHQDEMALDHRLSRTRRPDLREVQTNFQPTHQRCNELKGSK